MWQRYAKEAASRGASTDELISYLHRRGATIIDSMKILMEVNCLPLGEAKRLVTAHPVWHEVVKASDSLHQELLDELERESRDH